MKKKNYSRFVIYIIFMVSIISCGTIVKNVPAIQQQENTNQYRDSVKIKIYSGTVYLYGETHGVVKILNKEFDLWYDYYHTKGMRHLFVELPFFTAEFLNVWMKSTEDTILESLYSDWQGTALHNTNILAFYKK